MYTFFPNYDVGPDGRRFLMIKASEQESAATQINVVLNWLEELKHRVPTRKSDIAAGTWRGPLGRGDIPGTPGWGMLSGPDRRWFQKT